MEENSNYKQIIQSNIILFLSYSILLGFIFGFIVLFVKLALQNMINPFLSITLSLICGILIFHLLHFISSVSTISTFKEKKLDSENANKYLNKMNLFYIICMILCINICIGYLVFNNIYFTNAIHSAYSKYSYVSYEFAEKVAQNIQETYYLTFPGKVCATIIIELSLSISFFSLIPYQKKLLHKCNK